MSDKFAARRARACVRASVRAYVCGRVGVRACVRAVVRYYSVADEKGEETSRSQADLWDQLNEARAESR